MKRISILVIDTGTDFQNCLESAIQKVCALIQKNLLIAPKIIYKRQSPQILNDIENEGFDFAVGANILFSSFRPASPAAVFPRFVNIIRNDDYKSQVNSLDITNIHMGDVDGISENIYNVIVKKVRGLSNPPTNIDDDDHFYEIIGIAASTGGPEAICHLVENLPASLHLPIVITQHMPSGFIQTFVNQLQQRTNRRVLLSHDGLTLKKDSIYIAAGDTHLTFQKFPGRGVCCRDSKELRVHFLRPAADPMFKSMAKIYKNKAIGVVLTGLGNDGMSGAEDLYKSGSTVIVQDKASSVVWTMPSATYYAGFSHHMLPLDSIPQAMWKLVSGSPKNKIGECL